MLRDSVYLLDILQQARLIQDFAQGMDKPMLERDVKTQYAVIRAIEIIGEATRRLSPAFKADHPEIPWKQMAGMRSVLIHTYDEIDLGEVWRVIERDIPALIAHIEPLVPPDTPDEPQDAEI
jgi:uncharacterized protein with HEPN domain